MSLFDDDDYPTDDDDINDYDAAPSQSAPQSSSQPSLLAPRDSTELLGHTDAEQQLLTWWQSGRMPHTLVLAGPKGIGKSTLAFRLARFLLNNPDAGASLFGDAPTDLYTATTTQTYSLVASGGHPDMKYITRPIDDKNGTQKDIIPVDDVRPVPDFLRKTASFGGWRVVLVDDADALNNNAQNALLKVLEEPPAKALLILVTHNIGALIPTIRSRARVMELAPLSLDTFKTILTRYDATLMQADLDLLADYSKCAPGRAIELLEQGGIEALRSVISLFTTLPDTDDASLQKQAESLSVKSTPDPLAGMLDVVTWQLTSRARAAAQNNDTATMRHWLDTLENLASHRTMCENGNLDRRYTAHGALKILRNAIK